MSAAVGVFACGVVEEYIECFTRLDFVWKTVEVNSIQSVPFCEQIFRDESQAFLKAGCLPFFNLQIRLLNFTEQVRRLQIYSAKTFEA